MKRIDSQSSVSLTIASFFKNDNVWSGFTFAERALLVTTPCVEDGPIWIVEAQRGEERVIFVWETVTKYAYPCTVLFTYNTVTPKTYKGVIVSESGAKGSVLEHNGEIAILWD